MVSKTKFKQNQSVQAAFAHIFGDIVMSLGVLLSSLIIYFKPKFTVLDPIISIFFSIITFIVSYKIILRSILTLLDASPENVNID